MEFTDLDGLSINELYCMASLHFRKCTAAFNDEQGSDMGLDMNVIRWIFRWASLLDRLRATEEKILKIQNGEIKAESLLKQGQAYSDGPKMRRDSSHRTLGPVGKARSLSVMKSFANEVRRESIEQAKLAERRAREQERAKRRLAGKGYISPGHVIQPGRVIPPHKLPEVNMHPDELKRFLMDEAKARGDFEEAEQIAQEKTIQHIGRWKLLQSGQGSVVGGQRAGPSDETGKK